MATPDQTALRILLVDDEPLVRDSVKRVLTFYGHEVVTAASGEDALAVFRDAKFDLLITDYEMPDMKGDKLAAAIKTLAPAQPIIMITAYSESLRASGNFPLAVDSVVSKPFDIAELRETIRKVTTKS
ncbi:MAG TPA: response regulator [Candidatus Acidoferrum sp.]|nr:response regulator [Candidatus Acidoferrum sp.]